jgi:site-specific DNA-adenine methylase
VYQTIINQIPVHDVYIEAFLGNGSILRHKKLAETSILIDIDQKVIEAWKSISLFADELINKKTDGIYLINTDSIQYLSKLSLGEAFKDKPETVFIYCDPPYLIDSRSCKRNIYNYEMDELQHEFLLEVIKKLPFNIAISCYPNDLYAKYLKDWRKIEFKAQTRQGTAIEVLYMNYDEPTELHDYSFIGKDFRERERIRQKIKRHVNGLIRLPVHERNAIIKAITKEKTCHLKGNGCLQTEDPNCFACSEYF